MPTTSQRDTRLTYDDFVRIPDDGMRHEIIDGVHYVTPVAEPLATNSFVGRLHGAIGGFLEEHPIGPSVSGAAGYGVLAFHDVVEPDLLFVARRSTRDC